MAQFFLALAYESRGAGGDNERACGLFLRAARQEGPFAEVSATLAFFIRQRELGDAPTMCVADEHWQGGPPQSFVLGPDHRVVFTDTSITVTDGDEDQRSFVMMPPGDAMKVVYTPVDVTRPTIARRHFFQWVGWFPDSTSPLPSWVFNWTLIEVIGNQWMVITGEDSLAVAHGPTRPVSNDVSGMVRLRVNARGEAEYEITAGPSPRSAVIPWQGKH